MTVKYGLIDEVRSCYRLTSTPPRNLASALVSLYKMVMLQSSETWNLLVWRAPGLRQPLSRHQRAAACVLVSTLRSATVALISGVETGDDSNGFWIEISGRHGGWRGKIPDHLRRATSKCSESACPLYRCILHPLLVVSSSGGWSAKYICDPHALLGPHAPHRDFVPAFGCGRHIRLSR